MPVGGVKGGVVHGVSDPTQPADLAAVYHCIGVGMKMELRDKLNRPPGLGP